MKVKLTHLTFIDRGSTRNLKFHVISPPDYHEFSSPISAIGASYIDVGKNEVCGNKTDQLEISEHEEECSEDMSEKDYRIPESK